MKRKSFCWLLIVLAMASMVFADGSNPNTESKTKPESSAAYNNVYRDPVTGKFGPPPVVTGSNPPLDLSTMEPNLTTSSEGLTEEYATSGKMIRLNGRFQDATTVTIDAAGKIVPISPPSVSGSANQKSQ